MASKVTCSNCGWSWNKSDSSKKDMYVCHQCGRDNSNKSERWLDKYDDGGTMQEHQENYNDYSVSAPEGMQGDGYSNVGRDYSPAWGGQFQMGGSLPGAVGFTYARTQGSAPANGKYTKKTKASAQNGQEMSYYQHGLDFKTKGMKNGGWLDIPQAQRGNSIFKAPITPEYTRGYDSFKSPEALKNEFINKEAAKKETAYRENFINKESVRPAEAKQSVTSKGWDVLTHPMTALSYKVKGQEIPDYFSRGETNPYELAVDIVNPFTYAESVASVVPQTADMIRDPNLNKVLPLAGSILQNLPVAHGAMSEINRLSPYFKKGLDTWKKTSDIENKALRLKNAIYSGSLAEELPGDRLHHSFFNMTPEQVSEALSKEKLYAKPGDALGDLNMSLNSSPLYWASASRDLKKFPLVRTGEFQPTNQFGWKGKSIYNAIPEEVKSKYSTELQNFAKEKNGLENELKRVTDDEHKSFIKKRLKRLIDQDPTKKILENIYHESPEAANQFLTNYKPSMDRFIRTSNEASGLNFPMTETKFAGYNVPTGINIKNPNARIKNILSEGVKDFSRFGKKSRARETTSAWDNIGAPSLSRQELFELTGDEMYNDIISHYDNGTSGTIELKQGGVIKDDMGYWNPDNRGKVVEIDSPYITMEGVDEPLIGISDEGDQQYMTPGKNYKFKGKRVREYPVAKNGLRQEQKGLQNIDQLTNFTNYNTPRAQNGDFLSKGKMETRSGEKMTFAQANQILKKSLAPMIAEKAEYINSPLYKKRLVGMGEKDPKQVVKDRLQELKKIEFSSYDPRMNANVEKSEPSRTNKMFRSDKEGKTIGDYPAISLGVGWTPSTAAHELGHVTSSQADRFVSTPYTGTGETMSPTEAKEFLNLSKAKPEFKKGALALYDKNVRSNISNPYGAIYDTDLGSSYATMKGIDEHSIGSGEAKGDLDAVRYLLKKQGITKKYGEDITPETLKKAQQNKNIQNDEFFQRLKKRFSDEDIIKLNNTIAQNDNSSQELSYAKLGTKLKTKGWLEKYN